MKFIIGKKIEMTQIFQDSEAVPVTKIQAGPCTVVQVKTVDKDGYEAVQFGYGEKKAKNIAKPQLKHFKGLKNFRTLIEMRAKNEKNSVEVKRGDVIDVSQFEVGDIINVTGTTKGRGFQGVVKRHGFSGSLKTHGHKDQHRMPGSIGATGPAHVFKGTRMGGHMGNSQVTTTNLKVAEIDVDNNILYVRGGVPGARNGVLIVRGEGDIKIAEQEAKIKDELEVKKEKAEEKKE